MTILACLLKGGKAKKKIVQTREEVMVIDALYLLFGVHARAT
jgi:hypothetical protein